MSRQRKPKRKPPKRKAVKPAAGFVVHTEKNESPEIIITEQNEEKMEVHHHPHVDHKKGLKGYFLEFVMIFLAVTLGFFAEGLHISMIEDAKEVEYVKSMIADAETDILNYDAALQLNDKRIYRLDSLADYCFDFEMKDSNDRAIYTIFRKCLRHPDLVNPVERTMVQLKASGGMRLIESRTAADSIILYDDFSTKLAEQQLAYEMYLEKFLDQSTNVINYGFFEPNFYDKRAEQLFVPGSTPTLINPDKTKMTTLGNNARLYQEIVVFYMVRLAEGKQHAVNLIQTLKAEYDLE